LLKNSPIEIYDRFAVCFELPGERASGRLYVLRLVKMFSAQIVQKFKQQFTNFTTMVLAFLRERPDTLKTSRPVFRVPVDVQTVLYRMVVEIRPPSLHQTARRHHQLLLHSYDLFEVRASGSLIRQILSIAIHRMIETCHR
jgi:hypothetical protein